MNKEAIADYIVTLIKPVAPEVSCAVQVDSLGTLFSVTIAEENKGRLIGKGGETAKAIRQIVSLVGYANGIKASVKIL